PLITDVDERIRIVVTGRDREHRRAEIDVSERPGKARFAAIGGFGGCRRDRRGAETAESAAQGEGARDDDGERAPHARPSYAITPGANDEIIARHLACAAKRGSPPELVVDLLDPGLRGRVPELLRTHVGLARIRQIVGLEVRVAEREPALGA